MSVFPDSRVEYAIVRPSGEKYGPSFTSVVDVSRRALPPLRDTSHTSSAYRNATSVSDNDGARSK